MCAVHVAIAMKRRQKEIREAEAELERYKSETDTLQAKLIEAEKILVRALCVIVIACMFSALPQPTLYFFTLACLHGFSCDANM